MARDSAATEGPANGEGVPFQVAAEVEGQVLGGSCRITRIEGGTIRVTCTEDRDTEALRQLLRTDNAMVVLEVGKVREGSVPPEGGTVNGLPATPPAPAEAPAAVGV